MAAAQDFIARESNGLARGGDPAGFGVGRTLGGPIVDEDARPTVAAANQEIQVAVAVPIARIRPGLITQAQHGRQGLGVVNVLKVVSARVAKETDPLPMPLRDQQSGARTVDGGGHVDRMVHAGIDLGKGLGAGEPRRVAAFIATPRHSEIGETRGLAVLQDDRVQPAVTVDVEHAAHVAGVEIDDRVKFG